ncbi:unnamed protein product [Symbiodinium sp. CCMP2592]|nr:unnamed protein product [Symbiodinium sp. CCMP2592]
MFQSDPDGQTCRRSCTCQRSLRFRPVLLTALCFLCSQVAFQLCGAKPRGQRLRLSAVAAAPVNGLEIGDAVTATVVSVGETWVDADVEGAGLRGRMHKSDLTTLRIRHAREVVKVGDVVKCFVKQLKQDRPVLTMQDVFANRTRLSELQPGLACDAKVVHVNKHIGAFVDVGAVTSALVPRNDFEGWTEGANLVQPQLFPASGVSVQWLSAVMIGGVVESWEELCPKTKGKAAKKAKKEKKEQKPVIHQASAQRTRKKLQAGPHVPLVAAPEPEVEPETDDNWAWAAWDAWAPPPSAELELDFFAVPKDRDGDAVWEFKVGAPPNIKECIEVPVEVPKVKATDWTVQESWEDMCDSDAGSTADESRTMERTLPEGTTVRVEVTKVDTSKGHITAKLLPDSTEALTD